MNHSLFNWESYHVLYAIGKPQARSFPCYSCGNSIHISAFNKTRKYIKTLPFLIIYTNHGGEYILDIRKIK